MEGVLDGYDLVAGEFHTGMAEIHVDENVPVHLIHQFVPGDGQVFGKTWIPVRSMYQLVPGDCRVFGKM